MRTTRILLVSVSLALLVTPVAGANLDFQIGQQIDELSGRLQILQESSVSEHQEQRLQSVSTQLQNLERLHLVSLRGHPIRTEAQLHSSLGFLRAELRKLARDLGFQHPSALQAPATGTFSGTVTGSDAPGGLEGVFIDIYDSGFDWVASATTVANGSYITPALAIGDYFAMTNETTRYINELYDDVSCYFICDALGDGHLITVSDSTDTPDIDFELELGNTIAGTITDAAPPHNAIEFVNVDFFDGDGQWVTTPMSDVSGDYVTPGMPAGTYYAITFNLDQYLNERYDDQACVGRCDPLGGSAIVITSGIDTTGIDFDLIKGGSISGLVTSDPPGVLIENVVVEIYESNGDWRGTGWSDITGNYITGGGLPASGSYRALTYAPAPYLNELYDNMQCYTGCDLASGTPIAVTLGVETTGKNFALPSGGTFSGSVTDGSTGRAGVGIDIFNTAGDWVNIAWTDGSGNYVSPGLPADNYHARTWNDQGLINELYDDILCFFCDVTAGALIEVTGGGADNAGVDFVLDAGGTFSGTVTSSGTGDELEGVIVDIFDSTGTWISNPGTDDQGQYASPGLPTGDYYARTWNTDGYVNELYDDMYCPPTCDPLTDGTVIGVQVGNDTAGINFALDTGGAISGTITDANTVLPVAGMTIDIWDANGNHASAVATLADGTYMAEALPAETYFATTWNTLGYSGALYDGFHCNGCLATLGTPIVVTADATTSGIDFELTKGGFVSGTVTETGTGLALADIHVEIWNAAGHLESWQATGSDGSYTTTWVVPPGQYYVKTWNDQGYINENYPDMPCGACFPTDGTTITINAGATTSDIDFDLAPGGSISGTVTVADPNDVTAINIQILDANGDSVWSQLPPTTSGDYTIPVGLPTGTYYARTAGGRPYVNEIWDDHPCSSGCDPEIVGDPITVTAPSTTSGIDFNLSPGAKLTGTVKDATTQQGINDSIAEIFNPAGKRVAGCTVNSAGNFTCWQAVPDGTYYAVTKNHAGYIDGLYANPRATCVGGGEYCDVTQGTPIVVNLPTIPGPIHFTLDRGGWFEGSVIDAQGRYGLAPTGILIYDSLGNQVADMLWNRPRPQDGSYTSCGLPAGTYYALTDTSTIGGYHLDELYDDKLCVFGCNVLSGTPISVTTGFGTEDIDFELLVPIFIDGFESGDTSAWAFSIP